ncbi:DUF7654 domain-containing protein, partial [Nocardioides sp. P5_C9_2]
VDPTRAYEGVWNRGASYLYLELDGPRDAPVVEAPAPDVIVVRADPCWLAESDLDVGYVVTTTAVTSRCLTRTNEFGWYGGQQLVYRLDAAPARRTRG